MIYISLGANAAGPIGDPPQSLAAALQALSLVPGLRFGVASSVYRTEPQGDRDQPWFLNQVAGFAGDAALTPHALLGRLHAIERAHGRDRRRERRFGPRPLDLDMLLFDDHILHSDALTLPHPRLRERAFVLVPLLEAAPGLVLPGGEPAAAALARLDHAVEGDVIHQPAPGARDAAGTTGG